MSDFMEAFVDLLPEHNSLRKPNNELRRVLDGSVGAWFDNRDIQTFYDNLFLNTATGKWLDLHGKDYGVTRQLNETDETYRNRIVQEKLEYLTPEYLKAIYDLSVYHYVADFDVTDNTLTSDNPFMNNDGVMLEASDSLWAILTRKFILDVNVYRVVDGEVVD